MRQLLNHTAAGSEKEGKKPGIAFSDLGSEKEEKKPGNLASPSQIFATKEEQQWLNLTCEHRRVVREGECVCRVDSQGPLV